jgi:AraC-like DNA-binding protein
VDRGVIIVTRPREPELSMAIQSCFCDEALQPIKVTLELRVTGAESSNGTIRNIIRFSLDHSSIAFDIAPSGSGLMTLIVFSAAAAAREQPYPSHPNGAMLALRDAPLHKDLAETLSTATRDDLGPMDLQLSSDPDVRRLLDGLSAIQRLPDESARIYARVLSIALVARIRGAYLIKPAKLQRRPIAALQKWRLKRVADYVEAHITEPIRLAQLAQAAGLTRMYFAAQFRAAVGKGPHEYVVRKRLERAKSLLLDPANSLADTAMSVGFQTQAHFTTVFRRYVGETPHRWRRGRVSPPFSRPEAPPPFDETGRSDCAPRLRNQRLGNSTDVAWRVSSSSQIGLLSPS